MAKHLKIDKKIDCCSDCQMMTWLQTISGSYCYCKMKAKEQKLSSCLIFDEVDDEYQLLDYETTSRRHRDDKLGALYHHVQAKLEIYGMKLNKKSKN